MVLPTPDVDPVLADLQRRGYETTRLDGATTPPAVATGGDPPEAVTDRPLSVEPLAALESVDALTRPSPDPAAFPYRYERGEEGRFHVYGRDREVGTFTGFAAMESRGFRPVDLPLVPEHHLRENAHLARRWTVATVEDGGVEYVTA